MSSGQLRTGGSDSREHQWSGYVSRNWPHITSLRSLFRGFLYISCFFL